jgi:hypothetical protein
MKKGINIWSFKAGNSTKEGIIIADETIRKEAYFNFKNMPLNYFYFLLFISALKSLAYSFMLITFFSILAFSAAKDNK